MTTMAIIFLVLAALLIWGGLTASIIRLRMDGDDPSEDMEQGIGSPRQGVDA